MLENNFVQFSSNTGRRKWLVKRNDGLCRNTVELNVFIRRFIAVFDGQTDHPGSLVIRHGNE